MRIQTLTKKIKTNSRSYPIYIGFLSAKDILKIAEVPNFNLSTSHKEIAGNLRKSPVTKWQRPLDTLKRESITNTFNFKDDEFMPNPVLLSINDDMRDVDPQITVTNENSDGETTGTVFIEFPDDDLKRFWIIDGQHRIEGLGHPGCKQNDDYVPFVLLYGSQYTGPDFAKIFAQVTTTATPLDEIHQEWMMYAFNLKRPQPDPKYPCDYTTAPGTESMETVVELCNNRQYRDPTPFVNLFYNNIIFNPPAKKRPASIATGGKIPDLNCKDFADLIFQNYYNLPSTFVGGHLSPRKSNHIDLFTAISSSFLALQETVNPALINESIFFASHKNYRHVIAIKAYIAGVLTYLLKYFDPMAPSTFPSKNDWKILLKHLNFHTSNWAVGPTYGTPKGKGWVTKSQSLIFTLFKDTFKNKMIPNGQSDLIESLMGDTFFLELSFEDPKRPLTHLLGSGHFMGLRAMPSVSDTKTVTEDGIVLSDKSVNCVNISVADGNLSSGSTPLTPQKFRKLSKKNSIQKIPYTNPKTRYRSVTPIILEIEIEFYYGTKQTVKANIIF